MYPVYFSKSFDISIYIRIFSNVAYKTKISHNTSQNHVVNVDFTAFAKREKVFQFCFLNFIEIHN